MSRAPRSACWRGGLPPRTGPARPPCRRRATTALGALLGHITGGATAETFQPMNVNFGLFPPVETDKKGRERKRVLSQRALADLEQWLNDRRAAAE